MVGGIGDGAAPVGDATTAVIDAGDSSAAVTVGRAGSVGSVKCVGAAVSRGDAIVVAEMYAHAGGGTVGGMRVASSGGIVAGRAICDWSACPAIALTLLAMETKAIARRPTKIMLSTAAIPASVRLTLRIKRGVCRDRRECCAGRGSTRSGGVSRSAASSSSPLSLRYARHAAQRAR